VNTALSEARREEILRQLAERIRRYGMRAPVIWFLAMHEPLGFLGGQLLLFWQPLLAPFLGGEALRDYASWLEERGNIQRLLALLEADGAPAEDVARSEP